MLTDVTAWMFVGDLQFLVVFQMLVEMIGIGQLVQRATDHRLRLVTFSDLHRLEAVLTGFFGTIGLFTTLMFLFVRLLPMISIFEVRTLVPQAKVKLKHDPAVDDFDVSYGAD